MSKKLSNTIPSDKEVVLGVLNNSEQVLDKLYKGYFPMVLKFILNNNGDENDAKDIYQECIIILYNKIKSDDFELTSKLKTFIYSVCRRLWLKRLSVLSRNAGNIRDFEDVLAVEEEIEDHEKTEFEFAKMKSSLEMLGEPCSTIIQDFYIKGLSMQEIVEKFGYTNTDNAKTQKYKCLQRLKKLFFQQ